MNKRTTRSGKGNSPQSRRSDVSPTWRVERLSLSLTIAGDGGETALSFSGTGEQVSPWEPGPTGNTAFLRVRAGAPLSEVEEAYIRFVLSQSANKRQAAAVLGISPHTLSNRLRAYNGLRAKSNTNACETQ